MTDSCTAIWYDGQSSRRREVTVRLVGESLAVSGPEVEAGYPLAEVRIDPPLAKTRRALRFPDGATAETGAGGFLDELLRQQGRGALIRQVHRWEMSPRRALIALAATLLIIFCFVRFGIPFLAQRVAFALPATTEALIGRQTLQLLDKSVMRPSGLPQQRKKELTLLFRGMTAGHPDRQGWRLEFRESKGIGANAFALPSGIVIITDRMVELAQNDQEIAGVLAHEVGHLTRRHALRHLLQNSATVLLVASLTGDVASVSSLAAAMPTILIDAKYSRDFEREADAAAVGYLKQKGIPVRCYAEILARLATDHYKEPSTAPHLGEIFDNHPVMLERVKDVLAAE
jgi:Zn-dependent protease with chaperone function